MTERNHEPTDIEATPQGQGERPADVAAIEGKLAQHALEAAALTDELREVGVLLSELGARRTSLRRQLTDNREASDELASQLPNPFKKRLEALEESRNTSRCFAERYREGLRARLQAAEQELRLITAPDGLGSISILPALEYHLEKHARYAAGAASRRVLGERENPPKGSRLHYIELRGHFFNGKERVSQYPALFPTKDLDNPEVVISTLEKIIAEAYPPIIRQYLSVEAVDNAHDENCRDTYGDTTGYSYFLRIHANPVVQAPAPDEVR